MANNDKRSQDGKKGSEARTSGGQPQQGERRDLGSMEGQGGRRRVGGPDDIGTQHRTSGGSNQSGNQGSRSSRDRE